MGGPSHRMDLAHNPFVQYISVWRNGKERGVAQDWIGTAVPTEGRSAAVEVVVQSEPCLSIAKSADETEERVQSHWPQVRQAHVQRVQAYTSTRWGPFPPAPIYCGRGGGLRFQKLNYFAFSIRTKLLPEVQCIFSFIINICITGIKKKNCVAIFHISCPNDTLELLHILSFSYIPLSTGNDF